MDGAVVASVPDQGAEEVRAVVAGLRRNQPPGRRSDRLDGASGSGVCVTGCSTMTSGSPSCSSAETGKPWQEATLEVPLAIDSLEYYRKGAKKFLADAHPRPHDLLTATKKLTIAYRPYPVVGVICPWNNPVLLALGDALPALLAGAAVAVKPSELTPLATREIVRGWREDVGAPERVRMRDRRRRDRRRAGR